MAANLGSTGPTGREARRTTVERVDDVDRSARLAGVGFALLSAASFGVMPVLGKLAYDDGADPVGLLAARFTVAGFALLGLALARGEALPRGRTLTALCLLGGVGYVTQSLCYFFALERISAGLTALLLYFYPALVVVLGGLLLRDRPRPLALGCVALATVGTILTIGPVEGGQTGRDPLQGEEVAERHADVADAAEPEQGHEGAAAGQRLPAHPRQHQEHRCGQPEPDHQHADRVRAVVVDHLRQDRHDAEGGRAHERQAHSEQSAAAQLVGHSGDASAAWRASAGRSGP